MKMSRAAFVIAASFAVIATAHAEDWKPVGQVGYSGAGKAYEIEKGHWYWVGEFTGTFFNDKKDGLLDRAGLKCPAYSDRDMNNKKSKAAGYCIMTDASGDQAYSVWKCEGDTVTCNGSFEYTGGTGKYQKISGQNTVTGMNVVQWPDGTTSGVATWNR